jgi:hypothetical protein
MLRRIFGPKMDEVTGGWRKLHSLVSRAKVMCQNQKNFNKLKTINHDLMISEYPKECVDFVMKTTVRNRCTSDTVYHGTVVIPYVKVIFEKFRRFGNCFSLRNIFTIKHTLRGTLMKTGPVRDARQMKQCVYSIPCDCDRCYIGETSRPLKVRIKEHKFNLTQGLLEKSKSAQRAYAKGHKICWNKARVLQIKPNTTFRKPHASAGSSKQSTQFEHLSHLDSSDHSRNKETTTPSVV